MFVMMPLYLLDNFCRRDFIRIAAIAIKMFINCSRFITISRVIISD